MNYTFAQQKKKKAFSIQILVMVANVNTTPAIADWSIDSSLMKGLRQSQQLRHYRVKC